VSGIDPVRAGLVASLSRPGGNITGVMFTVTDVTAKRLELLRELVPKAAVIGVLLDPNSPEAESSRKTWRRHVTPSDGKSWSGKPQTNANSMPLS
jgi:putative ABC transport system substrate-binding protein